MLLALSLALAAPSAVSTTLRDEARATLPGCTVALRGAALRGRCEGRRTFEVDLRPVEIACENGAAACSDARAAVVADLAFKFGPATAPPLATVVPVVRGRSYVDGMLVLVTLVQAGGQDVADRAPVHTPFGADIEVLYMVDTEAQARAINLGELAALHLERPTLHAATTANAVRLAGDVAVEVDGAFESWRGGYYLSSLVFDTSRWPSVAGDRPLLISIPSNDTLLVLHSFDPQEVERLEQRTVEENAMADRPVSLAIFYWTGAGWERWTGALPGVLGRRD